MRENTISMLKKKNIRVTCIKNALKQPQISQNFNTEFHTNLQRKVEQMKIKIFSDILWKLSYV